MDNCKKCSSPLRIISGGNKSDVGSTKIITVHVWGCMNPECSEKMQEVTRTFTEDESFNE